jgi:hypothetical protein
MPEIGTTKYGRDIGKNGGKENKYIYLACQLCGQPRWVGLKNNKPRALICRACTQTREFSIEHNLCSYRSGENSPSWKGGKSYTHAGYIFITLTPDSPYYPMRRKHRNGILEHRLVMAQYLGRCLYPWELVHHKGILYPIDSIENKRDNRIENLELTITETHTYWHIKKRGDNIFNSKNTGEELIQELQQKATMIEMEIVKLKKL